MVSKVFKNILDDKLLLKLILSPFVKFLKIKTNTIAKINIPDTKNFFLFLILVKIGKYSKKTVNIDK